MADNSEEKKHAPTSKRLNQLRNKEGQVPRSRDFPSAISLIMTTGYIILNFGAIWKPAAVLFDSYERFLFQSDLWTLIYLFKAAMAVTAQIVLPVAGIAASSFIIASILETKGLVLSFSNMAPNFNKLNPVEGLKRIVGLHGVSEAIKILFKVLFMGIALYVILSWGLNGLFWSPTCEESCVLNATIYIVIALIIAALVIFFIVGVIDLWITKILFKHDNRMTETELKREIKEDFGSKEVRSERNKMRRQDAMNPVIRGMGKATVIVSKGDALVGMAYEQGKIDTPVVVGKLYQEKIEETLAEAKARGIPIIDDQTYLEDLMRYTRVGEPIPQAMITKTAELFVKLKIIKFD